MENQREEILKKLKGFKLNLKDEGFIIEGIFGSYATKKDTQSSDLDILYSIEKSFVSQHGGFGSIRRIVEIKEELQKDFGMNIDLAVKSELTKTARKYILKDLIYV